MISPLELKNKEFSVRMRGYDRNEVDDFLGLLIGDYESLYRFYRKNSSQADRNPEDAEAAPETTVRREDQEPKGVSEPRVQVEASEAPAKDGVSPFGLAWDEAGRSIRDILAMAQKTAEEAKEAAGREAAGLVNEAMREAAGISREADEKIKAAERRLADLSAQESALRARMKGFLEVYKQLIEDFEATSGIDYSL